MNQLELKLVEPQVNKLEGAQQALQHTFRCVDRVDKTKPKECMYWGRRRGNSLNRPRQNQASVVRDKEELPNKNSAFQTPDEKTPRTLRRQRERAAMRMMETDQADPNIWICSSCHYANLKVDMMCETRNCPGNNDVENRRRAYIIKIDCLRNALMHGDSIHPSHAAGVGLEAKHTGKVESYGTEGQTARVLRRIQGLEDGFTIDLNVIYEPVVRSKLQITDGKVAMGQSGSLQCNRSASGIWKDGAMKWGRKARVEWNCMCAELYGLNQGNNPQGARGVGFKGYNDLGIPWREQMRQKYESLLSLVSFTKAHAEECGAMYEARNKRLRTDAVPEILGMSESSRVRYGELCLCCQAASRI